jgi:hypothetical protein
MSVAELDQIIDSLDCPFDPNKEPTEYLRGYKIGLEHDISEVEDRIGELKEYLTEVQERIYEIDDALADRGETDEDAEDAEREEAEAARP